MHHTTLYTLLRIFTLTQAGQWMPPAARLKSEWDRSSLGVCHWTWHQIRATTLPVSIYGRTTAVDCCPNRPGNDNRPICQISIDIHHERESHGMMFANQSMSPLLRLLNQHPVVNSSVSNVLFPSVPCLCVYYFFFFFVMRWKTIAWIFCFWQMWECSFHVRTPKPNPIRSRIWKYDSLVFEIVLRIGVSGREKTFKVFEWMYECSIWKCRVLRRISIFVAFFYFLILINNVICWNEKKTKLFDVQIIQNRDHSSIIIWSDLGTSHVQMRIRE